MSPIQPSDVHAGAAEVSGVGPNPLIRARPRRQSILVPGPSVGLMGRVRWGLYDADTGILKRSSGLHRPDGGWYSNVILDVAMDAIGSDDIQSINNMAYSHMAVGSDSTSPAQSQTSLGNEVARTNTIHQESTGSGPNFDYWWRRVTWEFTKAEANATLAELGAVDGSEATFWMRQLFLDAQGNPTTISKQNDEILRIQYEHRVYPDKTVKQKTLDLDIRGSLVSTTIDYQPQRINEGRAWGEGAVDDGYLGTLGWWKPAHKIATWPDNTPPGDFQSRGPADGSNSQTPSPQSGSLAAYGAGTFYRDWTLVVGPNDSNHTGGIGAMAVSPWSTEFNGYRGFAAFFDPKIDKTASDELEMTFRASWNRVSV